jgi:predicted nucleic-acid-binding Zn-ribbon protein
MKNGQCPKCNQTNVYVSDSGTGIQHGELPTLPLGGALDGTMTIKFKDYVCVNCGYSESYIDDPKVLAKITDLAKAGKRWKKTG